MADRKQTDTVFTLDRAAYNQGRNAQYNFRIGENGVADTLVAKGPSAVAVLGDKRGKVCGDRESSDGQQDKDTRR